MAQGFKDFTAGSILTAADLEDYCQNQSVMRFATTAARDTALSVVKTAGMMAFVVADGLYYFYTGSAWTPIMRGTIAVQTVTSHYATAATHSTLQDTGMTLTFAPVAGHRYRFTYIASPYAPGGANDIQYRLCAGVAEIAWWNVTALSATLPKTVTLQHTYAPGAIGSTVFKIQVKTLTNNTQIYDYGDATYLRQFLIEDIGIV